jgi:hypothetical protein
MATKSVKEAFTIAVEEVAREDAERAGFDIANEPHGLARAIMAVFASQELRAEAAKRAKEMVERAEDV